jgi:outer membrane receptor protein involved in Fe transport
VIPVFELRKLATMATLQMEVVAGDDMLDSEQAQTPTTPGTISEPGLTSLASLQDWTLRSNFDSSIVHVLPLRGGRTFDQLALFAPGVARAPASSGEGPAVGIGVGSVGQFVVNGLRSRNNNFTVDGSDNNDEDIGVRRQGFVALVPQSTESVEEFQIMTAGFPAHFGRNSGSMVNAVSRSGQNALHGAIYGFFDDDALSARNFFDTTFVDSVNKSNLNGGRYTGKDSTHKQYGGVIGGRVIANRLFYFASGEQQRGHGMALRHFVVPVRGERGLRTKGGFVPIDELQNFFNDRLISYSSAAGEGILSLYPLPNNTAGPFREHNYSQAGPFEVNSWGFSTKVDWYQSRVHSVAARYNSTQDESRIPFTGEAINSAIGTRTRTRNLSLYANSAWLSWGNALRVSYGRTHLAFPPEKGSPLLFGSSPAGVQPDLIREVQTSFGRFGPFGVSGPIGQLSLLPYSPIGVDVYSFPQGRVDNTYQVSDFVTRISDTHITRAGFDIRHSQLNSFTDRNSRPLIMFSYGRVGAACMRDPFCPFATDDGILRGTDLAAFGAPSGLLQALSTDPSADTTIGLRLTQYDFFIQDDWKMGKNLTVNLGVRYELQTVPYETNNRIEKTFGLTPDQFGHLEPTGSAENQRIIRSGNLAFDQALQGLQQFVAGRRQIYAADRNNFSPRFGFAWDPAGHGKTAIHAGYSVHFDANPGAFTSQSRNVFPTFVPVNLDLNFKPPNGTLVNNPTFFRFQPTQTLLVRPGSLNVYNLTGNEFATGLGTLFNQQPPSPTDNLSSNGLAFTLPEKNLRTGYAQHYVLSGEHQFGDNWMVSAAYVGTRGQLLPRFTTPNGGLISSPVLLSQPLIILDLPPYGGRPAASLGAFTVMENSASSSYNALQLAVLKRFSRGLQFRSNWTWSHAIDDVSDMFDARGFFALPEDSTKPDRDRSSANFDVRHRVTGFLTWRGFRHWSFALTGEFQTGQPYTVNTVVDRNGDGNLTDRPGVGRNTSRAAGIRTADAAVTRSFSLGGSRILDARIEVFNVFNRTNFGIPVRILESPGFGTTFDTPVASRSVRLVVKLIF